MTIDLDKLFAETRRLVYLIHEAGLLQEFQSLRDKNVEATDAFQILSDRYPDLKKEFEKGSISKKRRNTKSDMKSRLIKPAGHREDPVMDALDAVREDRPL